MPEIKLKPCPFCGGEGRLCAGKWDFEIDQPVPGSGYGVECAECLSQTDTYNNTDEAIEAWNRRIENEKV